MSDIIACSATAVAETMTPTSGFVYVLELHDGKWYIGATKDLPNRMLAHGLGTASEWTRLHKPVRVARVEPCTGPYHEDTLTKEYMSKYGVDAVRGGAYAAPVLPAAAHQFLKREITHAANQCFVCGQTGHYADQCSARTCGRCGRKGHTAKQCYARTHSETGAKLASAAACSNVPSPAASDACVIC